MLHSLSAAHVRKGDADHMEGTPLLGGVAFRGGWFSNRVCSVLVFLWRTVFIFHLWGWGGLVNEWVRVQNSVYLCRNGCLVLFEMRILNMKKQFVTSIEHLKTVFPPANQLMTS